MHFFVFIHLVGTLSFFIWQLLIRLVSIGSSNGAKASLLLSPQRKADRRRLAARCDLRAALRTGFLYDIKRFKKKKELDTKKQNKNSNNDDEEKKKSLKIPTSLNSVQEIKKNILVPFIILFYSVRNYSQYKSRRVRIFFFFLHTEMRLFSQQKRKHVSIPQKSLAKDRKCSFLLSFHRLAASESPRSLSAFAGPYGSGQRCVQRFLLLPLSSLSPFLSGELFSTSTNTLQIPAGPAASISN